MLKCVKASENLTVGKLYDCFGLAGAFYVVIRDDSDDKVCYLPDYFERKNGMLVTYDEKGEKF